ncbi:DoxX family protein [Streptomyces sp. KR80]|uniref:DoxX family protein n=1 Tax=Streptomyces sp. KR80 TaxID=3457426 RepID=UPI003FD060CC
MSVDTRTPRPTGGRSPGFDDEPVLSTVKVPCDPAQVIVNHASFRVQLATPVASRGTLADAERLPASRPRAGAAAGLGSGRRRTPVVWTGHTEPGDPAAGQLLQAVRNSGVRLGSAAGGGTSDTATTQVLPRIRVDDAPPTVIGPRAPGLGSGGPHHDDTVLRPAVVPGPGAYGSRRFDDRGDGAAYEEREEYEENAGYEEFDELGELGDEGEEAARGRGSDQVRHAYYPGRRMNLGVVLLPLRVFLGFISIYAGMGKLCDPVYFDGGERGSMVTWLSSLHPWGVASPLHEFALAHPIGSGLTVAFLQVVVGVLTVFGLWQRVAASLGALLSAVLLLTVSWRTVPAYDAPDIIYLAAWSPLIIAGAPVYSMDARLAGEAWRRLGPRVTIWDLRRRVLRRGTVMATVVVGLTLLIGSMLGGAVRSTDITTVPGPTDAPRNHLPGSPLPQKPGADKASQGPTSAGSGSPSARRSANPSASSGASSAPGAVRETGTVGSGQPGSSASSGAQAPESPAQPSRTAGPSSSGGASDPGGSGGDGDSGSGGSDGGGALGGLLG